MYTFQLRGNWRSLSSFRAPAMAGRRMCRAFLALSLVLQMLLATVPAAEGQMPLGPFVAGVAGHYAGPMVTLRPRRMPQTRKSLLQGLHCYPPARQAFHHLKRLIAWLPRQASLIMTQRRSSATNEVNTGLGHIHAVHTAPSAALRRIRKAVRQYVAICCEY